jgi:diguanylate cyclase (GGDEF)-like protein
MRHSAALTLFIIQLSLFSRRIFGEVVRILVIDDEAAIHDAYRRSFEARGAELDQINLSALSAELFGGDGSQAAPNPVNEFELTYASQGLDGLRCVADALEAEKPFQIAFIDVRMPPGIDGKETAKRIREIDPDINLVIVTGFSDYSALDIAKVAGPIDKLFYISKPFDSEELVHTARALGNRWFGDLEMTKVRAELASKVERLEKQSVELAANEARANHLATHDALTGSANRYAFLKALNDAMQNKPGRIAVGIIDLDRFKIINDTLGHFAGDELIRQVCQTMVSQVGDAGMVARLGGDEFALLLPDLEPSQIEALCEAIREICSKSFIVFGNEVTVSGSVGVAYARDGKNDDPIDIMRLADIALYDAKRKGGSQVRYFDESMDESLRERQCIESGLRRAVAQNELSLLFQPVVDRNNEGPVGFEALLRWTSAELGEISPTVFIPVAEDCALIHEIGDWATEQALEACKSWPDQYVSINFSPRQFRQSDFAQSIIARVARHGVDPRRVQIEITETAIFDDNQRAAKTLETLREAGFKIALDDFGTGYSSLFNIRNFPLDCIKIDKTFVDNMGKEPQSAAIINAVAHLSRSLGLTIVAEGVETEVQFQALRLAGCSHMQGYLFGRPMTIADVCAFIKSYDRSALDPRGAVA